MKRIYTSCAAVCAASLFFASCGGGGGGSNPPSLIPPVAQSPNPGPPPVTAGATCPSTGSAAQAATSGASALSFNRAALVDDGSNRFVPGLYAVTYASDDAVRAIDDAAAREGARPLSQANVSALGLRMRVLSVDPSHADSLVARLRQTAGVVQVDRAQYRRRTAAVAVNDPYFRGFGPGAPYYESATTPGQWDMHVINVESAWGSYRTLPVRGAALAIVDTGVDVTHPDLSGGKVVRQYCYVTFPSSAGQSSGPYATDTDGHGTNVAGIADADTNNGFGFAGVAFDAPLLAYRIFPTTPSSGCEGSTNAQCSTTDVDEASAINDAVAHGARVINLSLGATPPCADQIEQAAVEAAISKGVVVVAAAGNESKAALDCPAAYPGVIAVGAEGPSGASNAEAVAAYSNYLSNSGTGSAGAYLVAPGGTASISSDSNDLHYILNLTSSQMPNSYLYCKPDFASESGDCRGGFAGTSQATPHVVGVVSLMLGLRPGLTPAQVAADVCSTAHSIGDSKQGCGRLDAAAAVAKALTQ